MFHGPMFPASTKFFSFAFLITSCLPLSAQESLKEKVDRLAKPYVEADVVVGMTIGVLHRGEQHTMGYGRLSKKIDQAPDGDTVYEIGSVTKVFTGVLLADAVARGEVKLDLPAAELLPDGVSMPAKKERAITLQDLATHASGLPRVPGNMRFSSMKNPYANYTVDEMYSFLSSHKLRRSPGEKMEYSNLGMGLLGHLLALREKTNYEQLASRCILKPLKMSSTSIALSDEQRAHLAPPHYGDGQPAHNWDIPTLAGAGALRSTTSDMLKFGAANLHPPKGELGKAIELAWKIHQPALDNDSFAMGLGWHVAHDGRTRWHNGQTGGYHASMFLSRPLDACVVLLTNTSTLEVDRLAEEIVQLLAGIDVQPRKFAKEIEVAPEILQRYVGRYQLVPNIFFTVSVKEDKLMVGLTGQPEAQVFARSDTEWFYKVVKAELKFHVDAQGKCNSLELFQNGVRHKAKRVESES